MILKLKNKQTQDLLDLKVENDRQMQEKEVERINSYELFTFKTKDRLIVN